MTNSSEYVGFLPSEIIARQMYAEAPKKSTWGWTATYPETKRRWYNAAQHAIIAVERAGYRIVPADHPRAAVGSENDI